MAAKLEVMFTSKYLPPSWRQGRDMRLLGWNCTNWWRNSRKSEFSNFAQNLLSAYWLVGMTCRSCPVFLLVAWKKTAWCHLESFGTTEEIIYSFTHLPSTTCSLLFSSFLLLKLWNFLFSCLSRSPKLF